MSENAIGTLNTDSYRSATHGMIDHLPDLSPDAQGWQRLRIMQNVNALCDEVDRLRVEVRRLQAIEAAAREFASRQAEYDKTVQVEQAEYDKAVEEDVIQERPKDPLDRPAIRAFADRSQAITDLIALLTP